MSITIISIALLCLLNQAIGQSLRPAIRVRLNRPVFEQASTIVRGIIEYEVPRISIPPTRQCFAEGCVDVYAFQMSSFRQPSSVIFEPHYPNRFRIRVTDFDFIVTGILGGTIQVILPLPISGSVIVTGQNVGVSAILEMQKTANDQPYLRFLQCQISSGFVSARVDNMGLITDTVNQKFSGILSSQSRVQLEDVICSHMNRLTQMHFSSRMARIPRTFSAKELLQIILSTSIEKSSQSFIVQPPQSFTPIRVKRETSDDYYDEVEKTDGPTKAPMKQIQMKPLKITNRDVRNFFNINRLAHILIDLTLLDAASSMNDFSLGISGNVFSSKSQDSTPYVIPFPFRLPPTNRRKMVEVVVSEYTLNSLLYHGHRSNSLLFHVNSNTPGVGNLLKTSCSFDEVCIGDEVPRIKSLHPNHRLELIIRSSKPPTLVIGRDSLSMTIYGRCIFFLEETRKKIGVIPFKSQVSAVMKTVGSKLQGTISLDSLEFNDDLNFLGLSVSDLSGLRKTTRTTLQNFINSATSQGLDISTESIREPLRLNRAIVTLIPKSLLLEADVDLFRTVYSTSSTA